MSAKHSPGPWKRGGAAKTWIYDSDGVTVAAVVYQLDGNEYANARLIAAAPELLAALISCAAGLDPHDDRRERAVDLIRRIEGEP